MALIPITSPMKAAPTFCNMQTILLIGIPGGPEALEKAKAEDKMILVSIGYAACHWCHVMEHESFEDTLVSKIMNENFINIKVDREERPDIDDVYMTACHLASGKSCGWPLKFFCIARWTTCLGRNLLPEKTMDGSNGIFH